MEVAKAQDFPAIRTSDVFRTFANRFARLMFLHHMCESDHPVLVVERELVEMARSKLQEYVLVRVPNERLRVLRPVLEAWVRAVAQEKILSSDEEDGVKESVMTRIQNESLADLLPQVH